MMAPSSRRIRALLLVEPLLVLLNLLIVSLYPLIFLCYLPFFLHRRAAILLASRDPTLGGILSGATATFAATTPYSNPSFVIIPYFTFPKKISRSQVIDSFSLHVVNARDSRGALIFPEIQQRIVARYGYHFWNWVNPFRAEDHVHYLYPQEPERVVKLEELKAKLHQLLELPFNSSLSPWEIFLVPNFVDDEAPSSSSSKSVVILRLHHCLAGGYAITNLLQRLSSKPWENFQNVKSRPAGNPFTECLTFLGIFFTIPYHIIKFMSTWDRNGWTRKLERSGLGSQLIKEVEGPISLHDLKSIKTHFGVTNLSSVLLAIVASAAKKAMDRDGIAGVSTIHVGTPWPLPHHPPGLGNHFSMVNIPVELHPHVEQTTKCIDTEYSRLRSSWGPLAHLYFTEWTASMPVSLIQNERVVKSTGMLSNFGFPSTNIDLFGVQVERIGLFCTCKGNASFTTCLSYAGSLTLTTGGDSCLLQSKEDLDFRTSALRQTFNELLFQTKV